MPNKKSPVDVQSAKAFLATDKLVMTIGDSGYSVSAMKDLMAASFEHPKDGTYKPNQEVASIIQTHRDQRGNIAVAATDGKALRIPDSGREHDVAGYDEAFSNMIRTFQAAHNIPATGNIGKKTKEILSAELDRLIKAGVIEDSVPKKRFSDIPEQIRGNRSTLSKEDKDAYDAELRKLNTDIKRHVTRRSVMSELPTLAGVTLASNDTAQSLPAKPAGERSLV